MHIYIQEYFIFTYMATQTKGCEINLYYMNIYSIHIQSNNVQCVKAYYIIIMVVNLILQ